MDTSGETHIDIVHNIYKRRLDLEGQPIEDPQREQGVGETKKIINGTKAAGSDQVHISVQFIFFHKNWNLSNTSYTSETCKHTPLE